MNRPAVLCLETATPVCAVALAVEGMPLIEERLEERGAHAQRLPGLVTSVLAQADITVQDLTALILSAGPGSYTGLRIGASFAKGLLFAREIPFYAANTLAGLALAVVEPSQKVIHAVIDARRTHVYYQKFVWDSRMLQSTEAPALRELREVEGLIKRGDVLCGTGLHRFSPETLLSYRCFDATYIRASALFRLFQTSTAPLIRACSLDQFEPDYRGNPYL